MRRIKKETLEGLSDRGIAENILKSQLYANQKLAAIHNWLFFFGVILILSLILGFFSLIIQSL